MAMNGTGNVAPQTEPRRAITRERYDAVLFDLDGVITDTASLHAACWQQTFDEFLRKRAHATGGTFRPFDLASDYPLYVDGKPRLDGVRDFLASRGITLPEGSLDDSPEAETVAGIARRKNELLNELIEHIGVGRFEGSVGLIRELRDRGFKLAIVTASENCSAVLRAARVDA